MFTYEQLHKMMESELESLAETLAYDISSLSKKQVERYAKNMKALLIATLADPFPTDEQIPEHMIPLLKQTVNIRNLHAQLTLQAVKEISTTEIKEDKPKKVAKKATKKKEKKNV